MAAGDCEMHNLQFPLFLSLPMRIYIGFRKPKRIKIPGTELAGEVAAVGQNVTRFHPGDHVYGSTGFKFDTYAEYVRMPEEAGEVTKVTFVTIPVSRSDTRE